MGWAGEWPVSLAQQHAPITRAPHCRPAASSVPPSPATIFYLNERERKNAGQSLCSHPGHRSACDRLGCFCCEPPANAVGGLRCELRLKHREDRWGPHDAPISAALRFADPLKSTFAARPRSKPFGVFRAVVPLKSATWDEKMAPEAPRHFGVLFPTALRSPLPSSGRTCRAPAHG